MAIILNIDTSGNRGLLAIAKDGICLHKLYNDEVMQHAAFIQPAVRQLLSEAGIEPSQIEAVAVNNGPGSYTGLRVGLASAKGLCFAWDIPIITLSSLRVMAHAVCQNMTQYSPDEKKICSVNNDGNSITPFTNNENSLPVLYCPMIDARRDEVFFALYNSKLETIVSARAAIVDEQFLQAYLIKNYVIFFGTGAAKWKAITTHKNAHFVTESLLDKALCCLSEQEYRLSNFDTLDTAEPFYAKEFYSTHPANRS